MAKFLRTEEYVPYAPADIGRRVRVNHDDADCSGSSKSMVIERKEDGYIYASCHRCGKYGRHAEGTVRSFFGASKGGGPSISGERATKMPRDSDNDIRAWPATAQVWIRQAGVTNDEVKQYGIVYSPSLGRVLIPVYNGKDMIGWQARKIDPSDEGPKYYTKTVAPEKMVVFSHRASVYKHIVLCEDVLSCIRIGRMMPAIAILGTSVSDYAIKELTKHATSAIIYLDYDNRIVKKKSRMLKNRLELLMEKVFLVTNALDPKTLTDTELKDLLSKYI